MPITEERLREILVKKIGSGRGNKTRLAKEWGVTLTYVSGLVDGSRPISGQVAEKLGFEEMARQFRKKV